MRARIREDGDESPVDLAVLDEDLRWGRIRPDAELQHPPWTGWEFRAIRDIPELADALDSPNARFAAWIRAKKGTPVAYLLTALVFLAGATQQVLVGFDMGGLLPEGFGALVDRLSVGLEPTLLDQGFWTPLSSQFVHSPRIPIVHMLFNIPLIAYCGFRVERALGKSGFALVVAASAAGGALLICGFSSVPVVGSSIVAYGLWGAQITVGFRMGDAVPEGWKGRYGWGNFKFFAPLYAMNLLAAEVSHLGHAGGLLGGCLAVMIMRPVSTAPAAGVARRGWLNLGGAAALAIFPGAALALAGGMVHSYQPTEIVERPEDGLRLEMPAHMVALPVSGRGFDGWKLGPNANDVVFVGLRLMREHTALDPAYVGDFWASMLPGAPVPRDPPAALGPDWQAAAFDMVDPETGQAQMHLVEHQLYRGRYALRVGWYLDISGGERPARQALLDHVLHSIEVGPLPMLVEEQARFDRNPESPSRAYDLANALAKAGELDRADALLATLSTRTDAWRWDAARRRLTLWNEHPALLFKEERVWLEPFLAEASPSDGVIHYQGVAWLVARGDCDRAQAHVSELHQAIGPGGWSPSMQGQLEDMVQELRLQAGGCTDPG